MANFVRFNVHELTNRKTVCICNVTKVDHVIMWFSNCHVSHTSYMVKLEYRMEKKADF